MAKLLPRANQAGAATALDPTRALVVGREGEGLPLHDSAVSREHAVVVRGDDGWLVRDLGSSNGTFVNGRKVGERRLRSGDLIRFGPKAEFRFLDEREPSPLARAQMWLFRLALVARTEAATPRRVTIGRSPVVVGRGGAASLRIDRPQISDVHARLESRAGETVVADPRSRNGTWVNGERVTERRLLPGDEVAFGDQPFDVVRSWRPTIRGSLVGLGVVFLGILGGAVATWQGRDSGALESLWTRQMYEEQARTSLADAVRAYDRRPPAIEVAQAQFDIARRSLIAADRLRPDTQTDDEVATAYRWAAAPLGDLLGGRDPFRILQSLEEKEDRVEVPDQGDVVAAELSRILAEFGIDTAETEVPPELMAEVRHFVDWWSNDKRDYTLRCMERSRPHLASIRRVFAENHLPEVFAYLPFIESGYQTTISSPAGARGLWQFMPKTARGYGLRVDDEVDQRTDPELATAAACRYLEGLLSAFGANAFMCAVAAYNKGEYGMVTCLKRISWRSKWKFWDMVERKDGCLKQETIEYVPRFLAAAIVMRRPEAFGLLDTGASR